MTRSQPIRFDVIASVAAIAEANRWIEQEAEAAGVPPDARYALLVCAEELMANILRHGRRPSPRISLALEVLPQATRLIVEDDGPEFDVAGAEPHRIDQPLDQVEAGGLGIGLIKTFASSVSYQRVGGLNRVVVGVDHPTDPASVQ